MNSRVIAVRGFLIILEYLETNPNQSTRDLAFETLGEFSLLQIESSNLFKRIPSQVFESAKRSARDFIQRSWTSVSNLPFIARIRRWSPAVKSFSPAPLLCSHYQVNSYKSTVASGDMTVNLRTFVTSGSVSSPRDVDIVEPFHLLVQCLVHCYLHSQNHPSYDSYVVSLISL